MHPLRILLVKTSSMGDVVHALPVVDDILTHHPDAEIDWLVEPAYAGLVRLHPGVHEVIEIGWRASLRRPWSIASWRQWRQLRQRLRARQLDLVIDLQGLFKSALLARLAPGVRVGWKGQACREPLAAWLYQRKLAAPRYDTVPAVTRCRHLCAWALGYALDRAPDYGVQAQPQCPPGVEPGQRWAVLLSATSRDSKLWPEADWIALGLALQQRGLALVLAWGSAAEHARAIRIADALRGPDTPPVLVPAQLQPLTRWSAWLRGASLAVGVDTGLTHLAAAVRCPVLAIYVSTSPRHVGVEAASPHRNLGDVGCSPHVAEVIAACAALLAEGAAA